MFLNELCDWAYFVHDFQCVAYCLVDRRYMQIRYQFIGDLDTIIIDKTLGGPNLPLSSLYGKSLLFDFTDYFHYSLCMFSGSTVFYTIFYCLVAFCWMVAGMLFLLKILTWFLTQEMDWLNRNTNNSCLPFYVDIEVQEWSLYLAGNYGPLKSPQIWLLFQTAVYW